MEEETEEETVEEMRCRVAGVPEVASVVALKVARDGVDMTPFSAAGI